MSLKYEPAWEPLHIYELEPASARRGNNLVGFQYLLPRQEVNVLVDKGGTCRLLLDISESHPASARRGDNLVGFSGLLSGSQGHNLDWTV